MPATRRRKAPRRTVSTAAREEARPDRLARALFAFFFASGACSLVYEVVWLRLAMAHFGVAAVLVSIVLSVFMAGLALGSWQSGRWARAKGEVPVAVPLRAYAVAEAVIGA